MGMNQGLQSVDHERQKGAGRKGCAMGTVEKEKELGYFQGCTGYYLCLIVLFLSLLILSCFTEITSVILVHRKHTCSSLLQPGRNLKKSGSRTGTKQVTETPFAEHNWDFSTQTLSALLRSWSGVDTGSLSRCETCCVLPCAAQRISRKAH